MISNLAYAGFTSPDAHEWRSFGPEVLGLQLVDGGAADGPVRLRLDERAWRIAIHPGDTDDVAYYGWEVADEELPGVLQRATSAGLETHEGDEALAAERGVGRISWFVDGGGFRHELVDRVADGGPFTPGRDMVGGFVTGEQGLGHVVMMVPDIEAGQTLALDLLGMRTSDTVTLGPMAIHFFHCAGHASRHHSMAMMGAPGMAGFFHLMLEVTHIDDVGTALDMVKERGLALPMDLGKHPNDLMTSFYVRGPSGFDIEYGTGGRLVDDDHWEIGDYDKASIWGHHGPDGGGPPPGIMRPVAS